MKKIMAFIFACIISLFSIYNVKAEDYVAKIGETNYATLEEAIKAAHNLEGKVIVHYVDEESSALLEDKILTGYEDDSYKTTPEDIEGYTLINTIGNETGKYTSSKTIEVTYVYQFTKGQGSVDEPVINPPVEEPPHTSVNTSIYALVLLVNVLGISVLLKKREN